MKDFRERFIESRGKPITHDGKEVHLSYRISVGSGDTLLVSLRHAVESPVQGLRMIAKNCKLEALGQQAKQFVLWADSANERTEIRVLRAKPNAEVVFMNVWRDEKFGSTLHGLNYSGIEVTPEAEQAVLLRCSDGWGPPTFDDLVVRLEQRKSASTAR